MGMKSDHEDGESTIQKDGWHMNRKLTSKENPWMAVWQHSLSFNVSWRMSLLISFERSLSY